MDDKVLIITCVCFAAVVVALTLILVLIFKEQIVNTIRRRKHKKQNKKISVDLSYFINNLASALAKLSFDKVGALIVIENEDNIQKYIDAGKRIDVDFFPEFTTNVFCNHKSPLHDGAMIIRNLKIVSLSSYLPMTKKQLPVYYGARHRAGIGVCEYFDCFAFIVSETTGSVTYVHNDQIQIIDNSPEALVEFITKELWAKSIYKKSFSK